MRRRIKNILIAADQLLWVLLTLGGADPYETISAACWKREQRGNASASVFRIVIDFIFLPFEKNHCKNSAISEIDRKKLEPFHELYE